MIRRGLFVFLAAVAFATPAFAGPKYDCNPIDPDVAAANEAAGVELAATCICAEATRPSEHKRCVTGVLNARVRANLLGKGCARYVKTYYLPSSCGYPAGSVACARRASGFAGLPQCRIVPSEDLCTPPARGGVACRAVTCNDAIGGVYDPDGPYSDCTTQPAP
jgi:hypothetical protein